MILNVCIDAKLFRNAKAESQRSEKYLAYKVGYDYFKQEVCLFVLLLNVPSQQLWSLRDGQFTEPHFFLGRLEQAVNQ